MNEPTFTKGAWYAVKDQPHRRGVAVTILRRSVCLAMNGNDEDRHAFLRDQLQPVSGPVGYGAGAFKVPGGKP